MLGVLLVEAFILGDGVRLRAEASPKGGVIATLKRGQSVRDLNERVGAFCGIAVGKEIGYVACEYLGAEPPDGAQVREPARAARPRANREQVVDEESAPQQRRPAVAREHGRAQAADPSGIFGEFALGISRGNFTFDDDGEADTGYAFRGTLGYAWEVGFHLGGSIAAQGYEYRYVLQTGVEDADTLKLTLATITLDLGWNFVLHPNFEIPLTLRLGSVGAEIDGRLIADEASGGVFCLATGARVLMDSGFTIGMVGELCENGVGLREMQGEGIESAILALTIGGR